ncbi:MAG: DUF1844 domain-containing protein, partial [Nitrospinota bacterium]|nr:DUF1844 domain-containing protein [Nitrospinota bacterium]
MPSASNEDEDGTFSFVDKRHRDEEREDAPESKPATENKPADEDLSATKDQPASEAQSATESPSSTNEEEELKAPPIDFSTFVLSLASNAVYSLGGFQDPVSGKTSVNLSQAKQAIDILSMIEE